MPGYELVIVAPRDERTEKIHCSECRLLLRDPVQLIKTGQLYCQTCVPNDSTEYRPDVAVQKEVMEQHVYCSHRVRGCQWQDSVKYYKDHSKSCKFQSKKSRLEQVQEENQQLRESILKLEDKIEQLLQSHETVPLCAHGDSSGSLYSFAPVLSENSLGKIDFSAIHPLTEEAHDQKPWSSSLKPSPDIDSGGKKAEEQDVPHPTAHSESQGSTNFDEVMKNSQKTVATLLEKNEQCRDEINSQDVKIKRFSRGVDAWYKVAHLPDTSHQGKTKIGIKLDSFYPINVETPPCVSRYRWRIQDVAKHLRYAHSHPDQPLVSPWWPIATCYGSYRMCAQIYPYGNGRCRSTHISAFMAVIRGPDDPLLSWPLNGTLSFFLLDQEKKTRPIVRTLQSDSNSSSFLRPRQACGSEMNVASGCPDFTPITTLYDNRYVKDDNMYWEVTFLPFCNQ